MENSHEEENEQQLFRSPRVNLDLTAQQQAAFSQSRLDEITNRLVTMPKSPSSPMDQRQLAIALLCDSLSLLEGMEYGKILHGNSRILSNVIRVCELLEQSDPNYDEIVKDLQSAIIRLSQHGLTIDGFPLTERKHIDRARD